MLFLLSTPCAQPHFTSSPMPQPAASSPQTHRTLLCQSCGLTGPGPPSVWSGASCTTITHCPSARPPIRPCLAGQPQSPAPSAIIIPCAWPALCQILGRRSVLLQQPVQRLAAADTTPSITAARPERVCSGGLVGWGGLGHPSWRSPLKWAQRGSGPDTGAAASLLQLCPVLAVNTFSSNHTRSLL